MSWVGNVAEKPDLLVTLHTSISNAYVISKKAAGAY